MNPLDELAALQAQPDPIAAAEQLAALLDLTSAGITIRGARIYGKGRTAAVEIDLSNGEVMTFDQARIMMRPAELVAELAACAGVVPKINGRQAGVAYTLVRALGEHRATTDANGVAIEWGVSYLQSAAVLDLDMANQAERWAAFERLNRIDPHTASRENATSLGANGLVLRHQDGTRLVRAGWLLGHVRQTQAAIGQSDLAQRMARVGWNRPGTSGRVKATAVARKATLGWNFYTVPEDWEADR